MATRHDERERRQAGSHRGRGTAPGCARRCGGRAPAACRGRRRCPWRPGCRRAASRRGPGPRVTATASSVREVEPRIGHRLRDHGADVLDVMARGQLRHHAAERGVDGRLRRDDAREDASAVFDDRCRGLVAGGLDGEKLQLSTPTLIYQRPPHPIPPHVGGGNRCGVGASSLAALRVVERLGLWRRSSTTPTLSLPTWGEGTAVALGRRRSPRSASSSDSGRGPASSAWPGAQALLVGRSCDAALADDGRDVAVRRDVEGRVADPARRREPGAVRRGA